MVQIICELAALRAGRAALDGTVALVPTMGALHAGHLALIEAAAACADHVIVSIFVNPRQFAPGEDLSRYPRDEAADVAALKGAGVATLWAPDVATMYPSGFATTVSVAGPAEGLCGASRPGHFDGVATVVAKLFGQVRPDVALFGEKDWQQLAVVRRMTEDLNLAVEIVAVPIMREADGLALSSRNAYLSASERAAAVTLPRALHDAARAIDAGRDEALVLQDIRMAVEAVGLRVDYIERREDRLLAAVWAGRTRLIDNIAIG